MEPLSDIGKIDPSYDHGWISSSSSRDPFRNKALMIVRFMQISCMYEINLDKTRVVKENTNGEVLRSAWGSW